jgi:hypothetical protein
MPPFRVGRGQPAAGIDRELVVVVVVDLQLASRSSRGRSRGCGGGAQRQDPFGIPWSVFRWCGCSWQSLLILSVAVSRAGSTGLFARPGKPVKNMRMIKYKKF